MDTILFKYSQFFDDDGGFTNVKKDFEKLGDQLVSEAESIQKRVNDAFKFGNTEDLEKSEKQMDDLMKTVKKFSDAKESLNKVEQEFQKLQKKGNKTTEEQVDSLAALDKKLNEYRLDLAKANKLEKDGIKTGEDFNKIRVQAQLNIKQTQTEIRKLQKEIIEQNKLSRQEEKLLRSKLILQKEEVSNLDEVRERIAALRVVRNATNITTQEGRDAVAGMNKEIDELTELLSDNSDKFIQNKINIGNYEEAIKNAIKSTNVFATGIGVLDDNLNNLLGALTLNAEELAKMEEALQENTSAVKRFTVAFGKLNKTLKASIIGIIILAIAALGAAFGNTRAGAIRLEKAMMSFNSILSTVGQTAKAVFVGIGNSFAILIRELGDRSIGDIIKDALTGDLQADLFTGIGEEIIKTFDNVSNIVSNGAKAVVVGLENIDKAFALEDRIRVLNQEIERLNGVLQITQSIADDSTKSLTTQLLANEKALRLTEQIGSKQLEIAKAQLEAANERVKQNVLANGVEAKNLNLGLQGRAFAQDVLDLAQKRGSSLEINNDLLDEQQQAVIEVIKAENELALTVEENAKKRREIQRDIFEQNLDLLIDLIDVQKNASKQFVNDVTRNFRARVNEFNRFLIVFRSNAQKELDEFNKLASQSAKLLREQLLNSALPPDQIRAIRQELEKLEGIDLQISFGEDGDFEVFNNGVKLTIEDIVELNKELQSLGLAEIPINRFREFNIETANAVRDFKDLNKELVLVGVNVKQLSDDLIASQGEIDALITLQEKINKLLVQSRGDVSKAERKRILEEIKELEKQKTEIAKFGDFERLQNRKQAILAELETVEEGSQRELELRQELLDIEKKLLEQQVDESLDALDKQNKSSLEKMKKFAEELNQIIGAILDRLIEIQRERTQQAEENADDQKEQVDKQEERARQGLENTLAFEQKELAKREAELQKQEARQRRLEQIRSLYSSYANYSSRGEENPILKTLRDFAILSSIEATFKEGGIVGVDGVKTNSRGITLGASHNVNGKGGNLAWHERGEGFLSRKAISNMGEDNFYAIKRLAESGPLAENFFTGQRDSFVTAVPTVVEDRRTLQGLEEIKRAIENKPVSEFNAPEVVGEVLKFSETIHSKNKVVRNHYRINKKRI